MVVINRPEKLFVLLFIKKQTNSMNFKNTLKHFLPSARRAAWSGFVLSFLIFSSLFFGIAKPAFGASGVVRLLNYQGRLTDTAGSNVANGTYNMQIAIYDSASGGTCVWSAADTDANANTTDCGLLGTVSVGVTNGLFSVLLGDSTSGGQNNLPDAIFSDDSRYLGLKINTDAEMTPRTRMSAVYQSLNSLKLNSFGTSAVGGASAFVPVTDASGNLTLTQNVNLGSAGMLTTIGGGLILGSAVADPSGVNGQTYYNTLTNKFRCFVNGSWADCDTTGGTSTLQSVYNNGQTINTSGGDAILFNLANGNFNATGAGAINLTPTSASQFTSSGALTLTAGAASVWSTSAGALTLDSATTLNLGTLNAMAITLGKTGITTTVQSDLTTAATLTANGGIVFSSGNILGASPLVFDGATANANKTTFAITDPTSSRTITFKNESGTVAYLSDLSTAGVPTADETQFTVTGFSTQTAPLVRFETFGGADLISFSGTGSVSVAPGQSYTGTGAVNLSSGTGALTITGAGASTWSTTAGNLTLQAGSGIISLGTTTNLNATGALEIASGGANDLSLTAGSGFLHLGAGTNTIINTDLGTNLVLDAEGDIKIADADTLILGSQATDPTGVNGAMYYDTATDKFRCFAGGGWMDCITGGTVTGIGSAGQVAFWNGTNSQTGDSGLFWDNTTKHLGIGTNTTTAPLSVSVNDTANNTYTDVGAFVHSTTGAAANGIGNGLVFLAENSVGTPSLSGRITSILTDVTSGAQDSAFTFQTRTAGGPLTERLRIDDQGFLIPGASDNGQDIGSAVNRWRTGYFGTSVVIGSATYAGSSVTSTGSFTVNATGGLSLASSSGTVSLGAGSNSLSNTDVGTDLIIGSQRNVKIADSSLVVMSSKAADPASPPATNGAMYYNTATNQMRCYLNGVWGGCAVGAFISASGVTRLTTISDQVGIGTASPVADTKLQIVSDDATANDISNVVTIDHTTSGTAAAGIGLGINFRSENDAGSITNVGHINALLTNAASGAEASAISFETRTGGGAATERLRITAAGLLPALTSNAEDIGATGNVWRTAYLGTSAIVNANTTLADGSLATATGNLVFQPAGSGTTANIQIGSGAGSVTPDLLVVDLKSNAGDPTGSVGAMYYNVNLNKFRCYENISWKDCDTSGATTLQSAYDNGSSITTSSSTPILFTLTSGDFNATGTGAVNLTPTAASQFTSAGALTFTAGAASTWGTTSGDLSLDSGSGILKLAAGTNTISNTNATTDIILKATANTKIDDSNLLVLGSQLADPSGVDGAIYYSSATNKFRCYLNGSWSDCDTTGGTVNLQTAYNNGNAIITGSSTPILFTLTSGDFNATGTGAVNLTPTAASQFTSAGALTFTAGAASTWGTSAGNLSLQAAGTGVTADVQIGAGGSTTPDLLVVDLKSNAGDPAGGANGAMYYNSIAAKFRCYEGGGWKDCDTTGGTTTLQTAYNAGASVTTSSSTPILFTLTSGDFNATGTGAVNLTPTAASQFTSAGALTFTAGATSTWSTSAGALTLTSASAATWGTLAGNLSFIAAGSGTGNIQIGTGAPSATPDLLVMDAKSTSGDPSGVNGAMYYNSADDKFRCYKAGVWQDCLGTWTEVGLINQMKNFADQLQIGATAPPAGTKADISLDDAVNNNSSTVLVLDHTTTAVAGNGIGSNLLFRNENDAGALADSGGISAVLTNTANGTEDSMLGFFTRVGGGVLTEQLRITEVGTLQPGTTDNALDVGASGNRWRTGYFGTSLVTGATTLSGSSLASTGALAVSSGGGAALSLSSSSGTLTFAAGTNTITNSDATTDLNLSATRNIKIANSSLLIFSNKASDPATPPSTNGATYYNTVTKTFRCYIDNAWIDCAGGASVSGTGTSGQVSFWNGSNTQTGDNEFYWDNASKQLSLGTSTPHTGTKLYVEQEDAINNDISDVLVLEHATSGTPAAGLGVGMLLRAQNNIGTEVPAARLSGILTNVTPGAETGAIRFETLNVGSPVERARIDNLGNLTFAQTTTISSGSTGTLTLKTLNQTAGSTNSAAVSLVTGNAGGATSNSGNVTIDAGTATGTAGTVNVGTTNASAISISRSGITTTINGALTASQLLTGSLGLNVTGAAVNLNSSSNFNTNINNGTSTGTVTIGSGAAGAIGVVSGAAITVTAGVASTWSTSAGNLTLQAGSGTVSLGTSTILTAAGSMNITSAGAATWQSSSGALTLTSAAAATWGTSAGNLSLQVAGAGQTANVQIGSGAGVTTPDLLVTDIKSSAGDPTGSVGAMYYNANANKFRCFENIAWKDCDTAGATTLQEAYDNGATITTSGANIAYTLTSGNFNATGAGAVNLTPTSASQFTSGGALTLTAGAASTWSTSSGALTLTAGAASTWSTLVGALTVDSASALNLGTSGATSVSLGKTGITTTNNGALTVTQTLTANGNITLSSGNVTGASPLSFDGATADAVKTIFAITDPTVTSKTITFPNATITVNAAADISGTTLASGVVTSSLTTVGILTSGSIASGFGTIATANTISTSNNISTTGSGTITSAGLLTGNLGLTVSGAAVSLNDNSNFNTSINAGTSTGTVIIGNSSLASIGFTSGTGAQTFTSSNATGVTTASSFVFNDTSLTSGTLLRLNSTSTSGKIVDINFTNTTGTIMNGAYGAATNQGAGALIGLAFDMNANLTAPSAGQNITGFDLKLPTASTTSNATIYNGYNLTTAGAITNGTAGSFLWHGVNVTLPGITQSAGGAVTASGVMVNTGTITTNGTANGVEIAAAGIGAGSLNGLGISNITGGAGTETAINIGAGWDQGLTIGVTPSATTGRTIDVAGNWGGNSLNNVHLTTANDTVTVSTKALVYFLSLCNVTTTCSTGNGTQGAAPTTTFNITGLPNTDGTFAFIETQVQRIGVGGGANENATIIVQVNGTQVSTVTAGAANTNSVVIIENYTIVRANGAWRVVGTPGTADSADLAEWIPYSGDEPVAGELVSLDTNNPVTVVRSSGTDNKKLIGVVSTLPHTTLGKDDGHSVRLALAGRVPVKVSDENGAIGAGDYLTLSSVPGVAMKATSPGFVIGQVLSSANGDDASEAIMLIKNTYYPGDEPALSLVMGRLIDSKDLPNGITSFALDIQAETPHDPIAALIDRINAGAKIAADFVAARVTAIRGYFDETHQRKLCVGDAKTGNETCITKDQLDQLLNSQQNVNAPSAPPAPVPVVNEPVTNTPTPPVEPVTTTPSTEEPVVNEPATDPDTINEPAAESAPPTDEPMPEPTVSEPSAEISPAPQAEPTPTETIPVSQE